MESSPSAFLVCQSPPTCTHGRSSLSFSLFCAGRGKCNEGNDSPCRPSSSCPRHVRPDSHANTDSLSIYPLLLSKIRAGFLGTARAACLVACEDQASLSPTRCATQCLLNTVAGDARDGCNIACGFIASSSTARAEALFTALNASFTALAGQVDLLSTRVRSLTDSKADKKALTDLDTKATKALDALTADLAAEKTRAIAAEGGLQAAVVEIQGSISRLDQAKAALSDVRQLSTRVASLSDDLRASIQSEVTRATNAERSIRSALDSALNDIARLQTEKMSSADVESRLTIIRLTIASLQDRIDTIVRSISTAASTSPNRPTASATTTRSTTSRRN